MEEQRNNPIPFLILATGVGYLAGSWWIGLLVGIGMTLIPGVALIALAINNAVIFVVGRLFMVLGFPFRGIPRRPTARHRPGQR